MSKILLFIGMLAIAGALVFQAIWPEIIRSQHLAAREQREQAAYLTFQKQHQECANKTRVECLEDRVFGKKDGKIDQ